MRHYTSFCRRSPAGLGGAVNAFRTRWLIERFCDVRGIAVAEFSIRFDWAPFNALDQLALLARQDYNLGGVGDWFGEFRGGLYGFFARLYGTQRHYSEIHAWLPCIRTPTDTEYHLASILFQMDSALECLTFALNALGWIVMPTGFHDVTDAKALKKISPFDILGNSSKFSCTPPLTGYAHVFPTVQKAWQKESQLIGRVFELHDVSKHRRTIYEGGQARMDPPNGFFESLGLSGDPLQRAPFWPMAEILLMNDPKLPAICNTHAPSRKSELLEELVPAFVTLIKETGLSAINDAQANIPLNERQFAQLNPPCSGSSEAKSQTEPRGT